MKLLYVAAAFVLACVALSALAQTDSTPRIDKRQANQERREWPVFIPQSEWAPTQPFRMPDFGDQRHALRVFIENLARDRAVEELADRPAEELGRQMRQQPIDARRLQAARARDTAIRCRAAFRVGRAAATSSGPT